MRVAPLVLLSVVLQSSVRASIRPPFSRHHFASSAFAFASSPVRSSTAPPARSMSALSSSSASASASASPAPAPAPTDHKKACCLQFHVTPDRSANIQTARRLISSACASHGPSLKLLVLPEIWNSPYATRAFPAYGEALPDVGDDATKWGASPSACMLANEAKSRGLWIVGGSMPERVGGAAEGGGGSFYNTCLCFSPEGVVVAKHRKVHLFDVDVPGGITFRESDTLTAGSTLLSTFDTGPSNFGVVGVGICYDLRFPELSLLLVKERGVSLMCYPAAFNLTTGPAHWELLQRARAVDSQCYVLTASPARAEPIDKKDEKEGAYPQYFAWGHSSVVNPWGTVVATTGEGEDMVVADIDLSKVREMRRNIPTATQKRMDLYEVKSVGDPK